jgi:hypothetical protein
MVRPSICALALLFVVSVPSVVRAEVADCTLAKVGVFAGRVEAECTSTGAPPFRFWAVPASDLRFADKFFTSLVSAMISSRRIQMEYTLNDTSGSSFGCAAATCRRITSFTVKSPL